MRGSRKSLVGRVVSDKMNKTVVVAVASQIHHPLYQKSIKRTTKFKVHDEKSQCRIGDLVEIIESRPYSKEKRWRVSAIIEKAK